MTQQTSRPWIPPFALVFSQLAHGVSWLLIFWAAGSGNFDTPFAQFAWIHTVALAWITVAALAILLHALPNFIDVEWFGGQLFSRVCIAVFAAGVALFVYSFLNAPPLLGPAASILFAGLLAYLGTAFGTIGRGMRGERIERAVSRAFGFTFLFLLATGIIGIYMAWTLDPAPAHAHAFLGIFGWLSLLIFGVSMRTLKPIARSGGTRFRFIHIAVGSLGLLGTILLAAGWVWIGGVLFAIGALAYAFDVFDMLARAKNRHRPPQAFIAASILWLLVALALGAGMLLGKPWQNAFIFALLAGWAGQMVNGHLHHIGIRLLATLYRGDEDETPPGDLLEARLSWYAFAAFQLAVAVVVAALLQDRDSLAARGAIFGFIAWIGMVANILIARYRAKKTAGVTISLLTR
ncbi:MAG TPA: hypothetical protein VFL13_11785 [Candidatus Baltobacteraceae bacterium]|nr:hypothetical protein [Candidatus Baltobacteraceae bacterium]